MAKNPWEMTDEEIAIASTKKPWEMSDTEISAVAQPVTEPAKSSAPSAPASQPAPTSFMEALLPRSMKSTRDEKGIVSDVLAGAGDVLSVLPRGASALGTMAGGGSSQDVLSELAKTKKDENITGAQGLFEDVARSPSTWIPMGGALGLGGKLVESAGAKVGLPVLAKLGAGIGMLGEAQKAAVAGAEPVKEATKVIAARSAAQGATQGAIGGAIDDENHARGAAIGLGAGALLGGGLPVVGRGIGAGIKGISEAPKNIAASINDFKPALAKINPMNHPILQNNTGGVRLAKKINAGEAITADDVSPNMFSEDVDKLIDNAEEGGIGHSSDISGAQVHENRAKIEQRKKLIVGNVPNVNMVDERLVNSLTAPKSPQGRGFNQMFNLSTNGASDVGKTFADYTPVDMIGSDVGKQLNAVSELKRNAGKKMADIEADMPDGYVYIPVKPIRDEVENILADRGIGVQVFQEPGEAPIYRAVYTGGSETGRSNVAADMKHYNNLIADLWGNDRLNPQALRDVSKALGDVTKSAYKASAAAPVYSSTTSALEAARKTINNAVKTHIESIGGPASEEYRGLYRTYAGMARLEDELSRRLGRSFQNAEGDSHFARGASFVKAAFDNNDRGAKAVFQALKEATGYDAMQQAAFARAAMDVSGDVRQKTLIDAVLEGTTSKQQAIDMAMAAGGLHPVLTAKKTVEAVGSVLGSSAELKRKQAILDIIYRAHPETGRHILNKNGTFKIDPRSSGILSPMIDAKTGKGPVMETMPEPILPERLDATPEYPEDIGTVIRSGRNAPNKYLSPVPAVEPSPEELAALMDEYYSGLDAETKVRADKEGLISGKQGKRDFLQRLRYDVSKALSPAAYQKLMNGGNSASVDETTLKILKKMTARINDRLRLYDGEGGGRISEASGSALEQYFGKGAELHSDDLIQAVREAGFAKDKDLMASSGGIPLSSSLGAVERGALGGVGGYVLTPGSEEDKRSGAMAGLVGGVSLPVLARLMGKRVAGAPNSGFLVEHGTPHQWAAEDGLPLGRNRLDKMGTGEGAQAFGWGSYWADPESGIAEGYARRLAGSGESRIEIGGKDIDDVRPKGEVDFHDLKESPEQLAASFLHDFRHSEQPYEEALDRVRRWGLGEQWANDVEKWMKENKAQIKTIYTPPTSNKYTSDIVPPGTEKLTDAEQKARLLDWDKPLYEQSDFVKNAMKDALGDRYIGSLTPEYIYKTELSGWLGEELGIGKTPKDISSYLLSKGIIGHRFLDANSRGNGGATKNTVLYTDDPSIVRVLGRNEDVVELASSPWVGPTQEEIAKKIADEKAEGEAFDRFLEEIGLKKQPNAMSNIDLKTAAKLNESKKK